MEGKAWFPEVLSNQWASLISQLFDGVDNPDGVSLSILRRQIEYKSEEFRIRMEREMEDVEFRLKRGSDLGRFDQFWDDHTLFNCRYSRSNWLRFYIKTTPPEVYSHALKRNKHITHISFTGFDMHSDFDVNLFLCDLPWVTSISLDDFATIPAVRRDLLFIRSTNNDLNTFAKRIELVPSSTYIFSDAGFFDSCLGILAGINARLLISFVAPTSGKRLILRVKHSGVENPPLELTLGLTKIQLNPSSKSSVTMDDITLYPTQVSGPSESDHLSFEPEVRNVISTRIIRQDEYPFNCNFLHDIELLDEDGLEYMPHSASLSKLSN